MCLFPCGHCPCIHESQAYVLDPDGTPPDSEDIPYPKRWLTNPSSGMTDWTVSTGRWKATMGSGITTPYKWSCVRMKIFCHPFDVTLRAKTWWGGTGNGIANIGFFRHTADAVNNSYISPDGPPSDPTSESALYLSRIEPSAAYSFGSPTGGFGTPSLNTLSSVTAADGDEMALRIIGDARDSDVEVRIAINGTDRYINDFTFSPGNYFDAGAGVFLHVEQFPAASAYFEFGDIAVDID